MMCTFTKCICTNVHFYQKWHSVNRRYSWRTRTRTPATVQQFAARFPLHSLRDLRTAVSSALGGSRDTKSRPGMKTGATRNRDSKLIPKRSGTKTDLT